MEALPVCAFAAVESTDEIRTVKQAPPASETIKGTKRVQLARGFRYGFTSCFVYRAWRMDSAAVGPRARATAAAGGEALGAEPAWEFAVFGSTAEDRTDQHAPPTSETSRGNRRSIACLRLLLLFHSLLPTRFCAFGWGKGVTRGMTRSINHRRSNRRNDRGAACL